MRPLRYVGNFVKYAVPAFMSLFYSCGDVKHQTPQKPETVEQYVIDDFGEYSLPWGNPIDLQLDDVDGDGDKDFVMLTRSTEGGGPTELRIYENRIPQKGDSASNKR